MPSIYFSKLIIESPQGKKVTVNPINAYPISKTLCPDTQYQEWCNQITELIDEVEIAYSYVDACIKPAEFFERLISLGYKIYWEDSS